MDTIRDACLTKTGFWVLVGSIWVVGLLGIIISSIAISNAKKLKDQNRNAGKSIWFLVTMLIIFIAIIFGSSIYGLGLYATEQAGDANAGTPKGVERYYSKHIPSYLRPRFSSKTDVEMDAF